jgi:hypothetical protein
MVTGPAAGPSPWASSARIDVQVDAPDLNSSQHAGKKRFMDGRHAGP